MALTASDWLARHLLYVIQTAFIASYRKIKCGVNRNWNNDHVSNIPIISLGAVWTVNWENKLNNKTQFWYQLVDLGYVGYVMVLGGNFRILRSMYKQMSNLCHVFVTSEDLLCVQESRQNLSANKDEVL
jgi:hypothetical protein